MGLFDVLKKAFSSTSPISTAPKTSTNIQNEEEIDPIYKEKLQNGLLPGEIVLLAWLVGKDKNSKYPGYYEFRYGVNALKSTGKLFNEGYFTNSSPLESCSSLKLPQLKEILKSKDLKVSGKKNDLIKRIEENFTSDEISQYIENTAFKLTLKGQEVLDEYYYIVPAHKSSSSDPFYNVATAIKAVRELNFKPSNSDISWSIYQKAQLQHFKSMDYASMNSAVRLMASQLTKEKRFKDALFNYLRVFITDLSGMSNGGMVQHPNYMYFNFNISLEIEKLMESLEINNDELQNVFADAWGKTAPGLPFHYLTEVTCFQCLIAAFEEKEDYIKEILDQAYSNLNKNTFKQRYNLDYPIDYSNL